MAGERRLYPRITTDLPLELETESGDPARAVVCNLSVGGIEIRCDRWCADRVLPSGHQAFPGQPIRVRMRWNLSAGDGSSEPVQADGEIVVSRRISQNEFRIGIHVLKFQGDAEEKVEAYVRARAR